MPVCRYSAVRKWRPGDRRLLVRGSRAFDALLAEDPPSFADHCGRGVVNFHPAPLPEYKGTAGYNLAILEDLPSWAVSAHYVDEDIDTGEIIQVREFPVDRQRETARTLEAKAQPLLLAQFQEITDRLLASEQRLATTANNGGRYVSRAQMEAMKEVRRTMTWSVKFAPSGFLPMTVPIKSSTG